MLTILRLTHWRPTIDHQAENPAQLACVGLFYTAARRIFRRLRAHPSARLDFFGFDRTERVSVKFTTEAPAVRLFQAGPRNRVSVKFTAIPRTALRACALSRRPRNSVIVAVRRARNSGSRPNAGCDRVQPGGSALHSALASIRLASATPSANPQAPSSRPASRACGLI
jgi:hypothetical protein